MHRQPICFGLLLTLIALLSGCSELIDSSSWPHYAVKSGTYYGFINTDGEMQLPPKYAYAMDFSQGYAAVNIGGITQGKDMPTNGKWGFIDSTGKFVINPMYSSPANGVMPMDINRLHLVMHDGYSFAQGLAAVKQEKKWIYINKKNEVIIESAQLHKKGITANVPIQSARKFSEGLAAVYIEGGWGYINKSGRVIVEPEYLFPVDFHDGRAIVMKKDRTTACINKAGEQILREYRFESNYHNGHATARRYFVGEKSKDYDQYQVGLVDLDGHFRVKPYYDEVGRFGSGLSPVRIGSKVQGDPIFSDKLQTMEIEGGKWGYSDARDTLRIAPIYEGAKGFYNGLAAVKLNGLWGYINPNGSWASQPRFQYAGPYKSNLALVKLSHVHDTYANELAYIDRSAAIVWIAK